MSGMRNVRDEDGENNIKCFHFLKTFFTNIFNSNYID